MTWLLVVTAVYLVVAILLFIIILRDGVYRIEGFIALFLIPTFWPLWLFVTVLALVGAWLLTKFGLKKPNRPNPEEKNGNFRKPRDLTMKEGK